MRLFNMYYVCKKSLELMPDMKVESRQANGRTTYFISQWGKKSEVLNNIAKLDILRANALSVYESIPVVYRDLDRFDISDSMAAKFKRKVDDLELSLKTIVDLYESYVLKAVNDSEVGFDMKMPQFDNIGEFSKCLSDMNFIIEQCPYLNQKDSRIRFECVDVGSTWMIFVVIGAGSVLLINNLCKIVDQAVKIKSHVTTVKTQEEMLHSIELKNNIAAEVLEAYKEINKKIVEQSVNDLEKELGNLNDGEERGKVGKSLEKLAFWMDKGLQIYASIDSPGEVKDLFPTQDEVSFLSDDIQKLIEMKSQSEQ